MGGGAVVAAAAAAHKRRTQFILDAFRTADATAPDRARSLEQLGVIENIELDQLCRAGVVLEGSEPGSWYLSETAYIANRANAARRVGRVAIVLAVVLVLFVAVLLYSLTSRQS